MTRWWRQSAGSLISAVVRINIPQGKDVEPAWKRRFKLYLLKRSIEKVKNPGTEVRITEDYMTKPELITWCSQNTLNCFLYDRDLPGLAATTDQCIVSGRPLAVSDNETFRHILQYIKPYPEPQPEGIYRCFGRRSPEDAAGLVDWEFCQAV